VAGVSYPVFIVCRDRLTCLVGLLDWLESVGNADEVYLLDNDSSYPPLLEFYETTRHTVIRTGGNHGHRVGWTAGHIRRLASGRRFVYTDPDVLPVADCPPDALRRMAGVLDAVGAVKCGFSISLEDLAPWIEARTLSWEQRYWTNFDERAGAYRAAIDTTFALYNSFAGKRFRYSAYRLPPPYSIRHLPWHMTPDDMDDEERYYIAHADPMISNYTRDVIGATA
jgi:hypothetical protein